MKNKTYIFLIISIALVIIKAILVETIVSVSIIFTIIIFGFVAYYSWAKGLKYLYSDFIEWFNKEVSFMGIFLVFIFFIIPFSSADKCLKDDGGEIFAGSMQYHCLEYNPDYKEKYTWINYLSLLVYLLISLSFYLLDNPKNIKENNDPIIKKTKIKKEKADKKKRLIKVKKRRIKRNKKKRNRK